MKELSECALDIARIKGASYADIRLVYCKIQSIKVQNGEVEALIEKAIDFGFEWLPTVLGSFAASSRLDAEEAEQMASLAVEIAPSSTSVPALKLGKFNFTGVTEF